MLPLTEQHEPPAEHPPPGRRRPVTRWLLVFVVIAMSATALVVATGIMGTEQLRAAEANTRDVAAIARARVFLGHQSVGANILDGLAAIGRDAGEELRIVEAIEPTAQGGAIVHAWVGTNGDPQSKIDDFTRIMDDGMAASVEVAILKFCYVDVTADTDVAALIETYTHALAALQARHPQTAFLYATVPLTTDRDTMTTIKSWLGRGSGGMGPDDNIPRQEFNAELRERVGGTGLLFDIAAVEAALNEAPTRRIHDGQEYYVLHVDYASDLGHLNDAGARAVAAELIRTVTAAMDQS